MCLISLESKYFSLCLKSKKKNPGIYNLTFCYKKCLKYHSKSNQTQQSEALKGRVYNLDFNNLYYYFTF